MAFFYHTNLSDDIIMLDEETSRHVVGVLRMKKGDELELTDGKGNLLKAKVEDDHKKKCTVRVISRKFTERSARKVILAVSLVKNANRFEWFLEKATEIGVVTIIPLICERTEKEKFRKDRMQNILVSAMLQSQQVWLPDLYDTMSFAEVVHSIDVSQKFIAHCISEEERTELVSVITDKDVILLIGPEGDFTPKEISMALETNYKAVSLGKTRLRTETAAIAGAILINLNKS